jgi:hypothetical protein
VHRAEAYLHQRIHSFGKGELKQGLRDDCEYTVQLGAAKYDMKLARLL